MSRALRSKSRQVLPVVVGLGAVLAGLLLLQFGIFSKHSSEPATAQVAAAPDRSADDTASRGGERTPEGTEVSLTAQQIAAAAGSPEFVAPADQPGPVVEPPPAPPTTTTSTTTTSTTTTTKPKPKPAPRPASPPPPPAPVPAPSGDNAAAWLALGKCESGNNPKSVGPGFYGAFQFSPGTWRGLGYSGLPTDHSYEVQLEAAKKLQAQRGWSPWPACSRKLGLR